MAKEIVDKTEEVIKNIKVEVDRFPFTFERVDINILFDEDVNMIKEEVEAIYEIFKKDESQVKNVIQDSTIIKHRRKREILLGWLYKIKEFNKLFGRDESPLLILLISSILVRGLEPKDKKTLCDFKFNYISLSEEEQFTSTLRSTYEEFKLQSPKSLDFFKINRNCPFSKVLLSKWFKFIEDFSKWSEKNEFEFNPDSLLMFFGSQYFSKDIIPSAFIIPADSIESNNPDYDFDSTFRKKTIIKKGAKTSLVKRDKSQEDIILGAADFQDSLDIDYRDLSLRVKHKINRYLKARPGYPSNVEELEAHVDESLKACEDLKLDFYIVQNQACNARGINIFNRCKSCVMKKNDACRFRATRLFAKDERNELVDGCSFIKAIEYDEFKDEMCDLTRGAGGKRSKIVDSFTPPDLPIAPLIPYNNEVMDEDYKYIKEHINPALKESLKNEIEIYKKFGNDIYYRAMVRPIAQICDKCRTSIFCFFYMCRRCGTELCALCYKNFYYEFDFRANPFDCISPRGSDASFHTRRMFLPFSCYTLKEFENFYDSVFKFNSLDMVAEVESIRSELLPNLDHISLPYPFGKKNVINLPDFQVAWKKGTPVVIELDMSLSKYSVDPAFFIEHYAEAETDIIYLNSKKYGRVKVKDFFTNFNDEHKGVQFDEKQIPAKIKDWPSDRSFKEYFECLYNDFMNLVPFPEYMRYDGKFNLVSYLPDTHVVPDLGPKMYNSYYYENGKKFGTTPLHLDAADAVNIMNYSSGGSNEPGALWHIFKREDIETLKKFILKYKRDYVNCHPIHDQAVYLTEKDLEDLANDYSVISHQIYQKPGDAVIIPAGCAHQVQNLHHCIKTAMDFVAPESALICTQLTNEFRTLPYNHSRCIDVVNSSRLLANVWGTIQKEITGTSVLKGRIINNLREKSKASKQSKRLASHDELKDTGARRSKRLNNIQPHKPAPSSDNVKNDKSKINEADEISPYHNDFGNIRPRRSRRAKNKILYCEPKLSSDEVKNNEASELLSYHNEVENTVARGPKGVKNKIQSHKSISSPDEVEDIKTDEKIEMNVEYSDNQLTEEHEKMMED